MRPCSRCRRHVRLSEARCPFCGSGLVEGTAPVVAGWAVGLAMLGAACGPDRPQEGTASGSSGETGGGTSAGTTGAATTATTGEPSTGAPTGGATGCPDSGCLDVGGGPAFIYAAPDIDNGECDPWVQDCPEGQKCAPTSSTGEGSWDFLKCVPVMEQPGQTGEPCTAEPGLTGVDDCDVGDVCWSIDVGSMMGVCVAQCTGTPGEPQCAEGTACLQANNGVLTLCLPTCDPLVQDCEAGDACLPDPQQSSGFFCVIDGSGEQGQEWDPCEWVNACDPGLVCANPALAVECDESAAGCCLPFCDLTQPMCAGAGQACLPWYGEEQAPMGLEDVGLCGIPL